MTYSNEQPQLLSRSDIADCITSLESGNFNEVHEKSMNLAKRLAKIASSLRKKRHATMQDDTSLFFIHEMNNLLSPIAGFSQLICLDPDYAEKSPRKMKGVMGQYLEVCSQFVDVFLGVRQRQHDDAQYCIEDMLKRTRDMTSYLGNLQGIEFTIPDGNHYVSMDFVTFFQIALNIIKNAERASASNIYVTASYPQPDAVRIDFVNDGKRISPEIAHAVFRKGFTTKRDGGGIGLAACRDFVMAVDGEIGVDLTSANTDFYMKLPAFPKKKYLTELVMG